MTMKTLIPNGEYDITDYGNLLVAARGMVEQATQHGSKAIFIVDRKGRSLTPFVRYALKERGLLKQIPIIFINPENFIIPGIVSTKVAIILRAQNLRNMITIFNDSTRQEHERLIENILKAANITEKELDKLRKTRTLLVDEYDFLDVLVRFFESKEDTIWSYENVNEFLQKNQEKISQLNKFFGMPMPFMREPCNVTVLDFCSHTGDTANIIRAFLDAIGYMPEIVVLQFSPFLGRLAGLPDVSVFPDTKFNRIKSICTTVGTKGLIKAREGPTQANGSASGLNAFRDYSKQTRDFLRSLSF